MNDFILLCKSTQKNNIDGVFSSFFIAVFTVHEQHHSPRFVIRLLRVLFAHSTQQYQNDGNKIIIIFDESNPQKHGSILFYTVQIAAWKRIIHQHNIILLIFSTLF